MLLRYRDNESPALYPTLDHWTTMASVVSGSYVLIHISCIIWAIAELYSVHNDYNVHGSFWLIWPWPHLHGSLTMQSLSDTCTKTLSSWLSTYNNSWILKPAIHFSMCIMVAFYMLHWRHFWLELTNWLLLMRTKNFEHKL